ncbi:MAG TPA: succinyldiaminopimelate transaminase [Gammaproteobacteria bacterium]|nr:succinyldiaminopimelate transaminase [Gammaproteobacteria bacterium]
MNSRLDDLKEYPFQRLNRLLTDIEAPSKNERIMLSLGEPKHAPPPFIHDLLAKGGHLLSGYPGTRGEEKLRESICSWLSRRFHITEGKLDPAQHVLPVSGSREAIFSFIQAAVDCSCHGPARVVMPNPFYQIYEGAAIMAGATPYFLNSIEENDWQPQLDKVPEHIWRETQLLILCSPDNPVGSVIPAEIYTRVLSLADRYDFIVAADECYSELYRDESTPPVGLLQVATEQERNDFERCIVFHSLSKRSSLPGLRSGFVAGDSKIIDAYFKYRTYHGCVPNRLTQAISTAAWDDDEHVVQNRAVYRDKFTAVIDILQPVLKLNQPAAGFYLWPETPINEEEFSRRLFQNEHVVTLPGTYLARDTLDGNPGKNRIRIALVAEQQECIEAAKRIRKFVTEKM